MAPPRIKDGLLGFRWESLDLADGGHAAVALIVLGALPADLNGAYARSRH